MVRIQDSQSWHRGSIPLSTTLKADFKSKPAFLFTAAPYLSRRDPGSNNIVVFLTIQYYCLSLRHE